MSYWVCEFVPKRHPIKAWIGFDGLEMRQTKKLLNPRRNELSVIIHHLNFMIGSDYWYTILQYVNAYFAGFYTSKRFGAEEAHWAHNPRVGGSKLPIARQQFFLLDSRTDVNVQSFRNR
jgi:hypothetical protein